MTVVKLLGSTFLLKNSDSESARASEHSLGFTVLESTSHFTPQMVKKRWGDEDDP